MCLSMGQLQSHLLRKGDLLRIQSKKNKYLGLSSFVINVIEKIPLLARLSKIFQEINLREVALEYGNSSTVNFIHD